MQSKRGGPILRSAWTMHADALVRHTAEHIMGRIGTKEELIEDDTRRVRTWRKPLSMIEINQLAPTAEVRRRPGRA